MDRAELIETCEQAEAVLSASEPCPITGPALICSPGSDVRSRGRWFVERVDSPSWETLREVATRRLRWHLDPDHRFLELVYRDEMADRLVGIEAERRGIEAAPVWRMFLGS